MAKTTLELYDAVVAAHPEVERKGAKMPYTSVNGNMFSFITQEGAIALRLGDADREAAMKKHKAKIAEQHGAVLKEYVVIPDAVARKSSELARLFAASCAYASGLKPKATTKKKKPSKR